jgi:hypothetical protein
MKKLFYAVAVVASMALASCSSCAPVAATSNPVGSKCGEAVQTVWLGFIGGTDDAAINKAAKNGGITRISHVDTWCTDYLVMRKIGVRVYGN